MSPQTPALRNTAIALALSILCCAQAPMPEPVTDQETELGDQMYKELKAKGEIVASSPLYDTLKPIADSISRAAQSRYPHPFKFFIVYEPQPNAFATPGGNVYVVDSLFYFVKNTDAGFQCVSCSYAKPGDPHPLEFCENGAKATAWEITSRRCGPDFFTRHTL